MGAAGSSRYCLACGGENAAGAPLCRNCGRSLGLSAQQERAGSAFLLNELEALHNDGDVSEPLYQLLRTRYRALLGLMPAAPAAAQPPTAMAPRPAAPARPEGPGWLAEQQANLLLYLGAFLIVIAALVYIGYSGDAVGSNGKAALLALGTASFLVGGVFCMRFPRIEQAGVVFFGVGALLVPVNFAGIYAFYYAEDDLDASGLWLGGSLTSVLFYGAISLLGIGRWYAVPALIAALSALGAALYVFDAPAEDYPVAYIALALALAAPELIGSGRLKKAFGATSFWGAQAIAPVAILAAFAFAPATGNDHDEWYEIVTRWYLPATLAAAALFYWTQSLFGRARLPGFEPILTVAALSATAAAGVTLVYATEAGEEWYGVAVAIAGWAFAAGSEGFGPRWYGQRYLGWLALGAVTASWLLFEALYADAPRQGAGVHFAASAFYVAAAWSPKAGADLLAVLWPAARQDARDRLDIAAGGALMYAAGLTLGIGYYHLLSSFPAAETAEASDASWPFFGLSLAVAAVALSMRWWWPTMRLHAYVIALGLSLFVVLSAVEVEGQVTLLLAIYGTVALALTLVELQPLALPVPAAFGFFALLAAWRYYEPIDLYLPLVLSAAGYGLFAAYVVLRGRERRWAQVVQLIAYGYLVVAPIAGWVRLSILADDAGLIDGDRFETTGLYQTAAASVLLLGIAAAAEAWVQKRGEIAAAASALLMVALLLEIGHFRPENAQAYTAPLGAYVLAAALLATRWREMPEELRPGIGPAEALGATLIMAPSFVQSLDEGAWEFGVILLAEGLAFVAAGVIQRRLWLAGVSTLLIVLDGLHYLFFAGGPALPNWAILAIAGVAVMIAGTSILLGRDRWTEWQRIIQAWWNREPLPARAPPAA